MPAGHPQRRERVLSDKSIIALTDWLLPMAVQELLDSPGGDAEAKGTWADLKAIADDVGTDIFGIAEAEGTKIEVKRMKEILGGWRDGVQ